MSTSTLDKNALKPLTEELGLEFFLNDFTDLVFGASQKANALFIRSLWLLLLLRYTIPAIVSIYQNQPYLTTLHFSFIDFCWLLIVLTATCYIRPHHSIITHDGLYKPFPNVKGQRIIGIGIGRTWSWRYRVTVQTELREHILVEFINRRSAERLEQIIREYFAAINHPAGISYN
ncbi:MAG: hypothetical protein KF836_12295 [Fimbriimonadaceae bacterium]|nr:hypothetical protein [Fimbriimonadaceae bacterium]